MLLCIIIDFGLSIMWLEVYFKEGFNRTYW